MTTATTSTLTSEDPADYPELWNKLGLNEDQAQQFLLHDDVFYNSQTGFGPHRSNDDYWTLLMSLDHLYTPVGILTLVEISADQYEVVVLHSAACVKAPPGDRYHNMPLVIDGDASGSSAPTMRSLSGIKDKAFQMTKTWVLKDGAYKKKYLDALHYGGGLMDVLCPNDIEGEEVELLRCMPIPYKLLVHLVKDTYTPQELYMELEEWKNKRTSKISKSKFWAQKWARAVNTMVRETDEEDSAVVPSNHYVGSLDQVLTPLRSSRSSDRVIIERRTKQLTQMLLVLGSAYHSYWCQQYHQGMYYTY